MKNVNPIGREASEQKLSAYGCICHIPNGTAAAISGNVPCNVCAHDCGPSNYQANYQKSYARMTHTGG